MPEQVAANVFFIERLSITLLVELNANGLVKIEPFGCKKEHRRLWTGIAKTQAVVAQMQLDQNRNRQPLSILQEVFQRSGWTITPTNEGSLSGSRDSHTGTGQLLG